MMKLPALYLKIKNLQVDGHRTKPKPFPGRYPTRLVVGFVKKNGQLQRTYVGKPCKAALDLVTKFCQQKGGIVISEFDRGGAIRVAQRVTPHNPLTIKVSNRNLLLERYYHPFMAQDSADVLQVWRHKTFSKIIATKRHGKFIVYSPFEKMDDDWSRRLIQEYRQWLGKSAQLWK